MKKLVAYPLSIIYYLLFGIVLLLFHPIQWLCLNILGYQAHKKSVDILNFFLLRCLNVLGTQFTFNYSHKVEPLERPVIIVSNHQSMYDIPPYIWYLRKLHPKFISKKELGKRIPSISYNLKHGGSILIDRKDRSQSVKAIKGLTTYLNETNRSVVIFAEGTRSRDGIPIKFARAGLKTLFEAMPTAIVLPVTIENSWKLFRWGAFPMDIGVHVKHTTHPPIPVSSMELEALIDYLEQTILGSFPEIRERRKKCRIKSLKQL